MTTIYIITGQTATGKTDYALNLAKRENGELINSDSRQIYKQLDIITGKDLDLTDKKFTLHNRLGQFEIGYYPTLQGKTKIWLYDIVDPKLPFSAFDYTECAIQTIKQILSENKTPVIVGGTYFYLKQLVHGGINHAVNPDWQLRKELATKTVAELQDLLKKINNETFEKLNNSEKHNPQRLIRWIEIAKAPLKASAGSNQKTIRELFPGVAVKMIGITPPDKDILKKRITKRVEKRIQNGAMKEVEKLLTIGYKKSDPGLNTIGYAQIMKYLDKTISEEAMIREWVTKELQYAKRQYTFMKKDPDIEWIEI